MPRTAGQSRSGSRAEIADPAATRKPSVSVTVDRAAEQAGARRALIGSGLLLALAVGLANALNAVFQFGSARVLERGQYSLLAALFAVVLIGAVPPLAFQATTARSVASSLAEGDDRGAGIYLRGTLQSVLLWTVALLALTAVARPDRRRLRPREPARDRGHRRHDRDRARDPRRLGRPAGSGSVPGAVGRDHAVCRDAARRRPRDRGRGRERRRDHARDRGRDRPDCARLAAASARPARPRRRRALAAPPPRDDPERGRRGRADGAHRAGDDGPARREARVPERPGGRLRGRVGGRARAAADPDRRHDRALPARRDAARPAARADASARRPARGRRHGGNRDDDPVDPGRASDRRHLRVEVRGRRVMARAAQRGDVAVRARDRLPVPLSLARPLALRPRPRRRSSPCSSRSSPPCTGARAS